jgi:hypothetical protein
MKSGYPSEESVTAELGDKVMATFGVVVAQTRLDLTVYRRTFPMWASEHTDRGLLSWCHDRAWAHLTRLLDGVSEVSFVDQPPTREMYVGLRYRLRWKKHDLDDRLTTYPTQTAIEFLEQDPPTFEGLEEVRLVAGYRWDPATRQIGSGVLSLRDGNEKVIWSHVLAEPDASSVTEATPILPSSGPAAPQIFVPRLDQDRSQSETGDS